MEFFQALKSPVHFGIEAPVLIWWASILLTVGTIAVTVRLVWGVFHAKRQLVRATVRLQKLRVEHSPGPGRGLASSTYEQLANVFNEMPMLRVAWDTFRGFLVVRKSPTGEDEYWLSEGSDDALNDDSLWGTQLNRNFYGAFPGIITGLGLLFTFVAILIALIHVKVGQNNMVSGVGDLINGLSGKFVSSIAALGWATIFIICEKRLFHGLITERFKLVRTVNSVVPRLSPAHILAELQRDSAEQTLAFRQFNTDLSTRLKQSFSESMGPTLQRMVDSIDQMNGLLRRAEAQKHESITGSLQTMLSSLESSISSSLHQMGDRFSESLSGATMTQFNKVADSLGGAADLLQNMNSQFQMTQSALADLVNLVKSSTVEQVALGKTQVEELTAVLRQMIVQLDETTNTSTNRMAQALTALVADLSSKVTDLNREMARTVEENATRTTQATAVLIDQADAWSSKNSEQLEEILLQQKAHLQSVKDVEDSLMSALGLFNDSITQYASLNSALRKTADEATAMATASAGAARSAQESHAGLRQVASQVGAQVDRLAEANQAQKEVWDSIHARLEQYQKVFAHADQSASNLLGQLAQATDANLQSTRQRYDDLVTTFDEHISSAVQKLGGSIGELGELLEEMNASVGELSGLLKGMSVSIADVTRGGDGQ